MNEAFEHSLSEMQAVFEVLAAQLTSPVAMKRGDGFAFRYEERGSLQAIIQRLARAVSSLGAAAMLVDTGFLQEAGTLQRAVDDFAEDVTFLSLGLMVGDGDGVQQKYLRHFYAETIPDPANPMSALDKRAPRVQRREIRQEIERCTSVLMGKRVSTGTELARVISSLYCSFVHGGSAQTMEMYGGLPPHFNLTGIPDSPLKQSHELDLLNQFYRTALAFGWALRVMPVASLDDRVKSLQAYLAKMVCVSSEGSSPTQVSCKQPE